MVKVGLLLGSLVHLIILFSDKFLYFFLRYDLPSKVMNLPFILSRSRMAVAVTESKIFPQSEGMRLVVSRVVETSVRFEMI